MKTQSKKIWVRGVMWVGVPLAFLCAAQVYTIASTTFQWYEKAEEVAKSAPLKFLFVGSSRVKAAIDVSTFEQTVLPKVGKSHAVNFGVGGSTMRQHLLGVRNLLQSQPGMGKGCVVFVETFAGVPGSMTGWFAKGNPRLLAEVMGISDLPHFWRAQYPLEEKLSLTMRLALFKFRPFFWKERIRRTVIDMGSGVLGKTLSPLGALSTVKAEPGADLVDGGGIRTDKKGVARVRKQALALAEKNKETQDKKQTKKTPLTRETAAKWQASEIGELVALVKRHGGEVVFFESPLHSIYRAHYKNTLHPAEQRSFEQARGTWGTPLIRADIHFKDADYPDISHLSKTMAPRFTQQLANEWLAHSHTP